MAPALELKDAEFRTTMQHQLGMLPLPCNIVGICFQHTAVRLADNSDHAMTCMFMQGKAKMRHDMLKAILHRVIHHAGGASTLEPTLCRLPGRAYGGTRGIEAAGLGARGDILPALESGMSVLDESITHPSGVAKRTVAVTTDDAEAARRGREKGRTYGRLEPTGTPSSCSHLRRTAAWASRP
jgi:hypothetical protein